MEEDHLSGNKTPPSWGLGGSAAASQPIPTGGSSFFEFNTQSFGLPSPRHSPSLGTPSMHIDLSSNSSLDSYPLFNRRSGGGTASNPILPFSNNLHPPSTSSSSSQQPNSFFPAFPSTSSFRKPSLLACSEPLLPPVALSPPQPSSPSQSGSDLDDFDDREGSDSPMVLGSPSFDIPMLPLTVSSQGQTSIAGGYRSRESRSRSTSESMSGASSVFGGAGGAPLGNTSSMGSVAPASPVMLARALQGGQRTPPPFLQRKLFHGMQDDGVDSSSSGSGSGIEQSGRRSSTAVGKERELTDVEREEEEDAFETGIGNTKDGSSSASGEEGGRVVRRPVSRKPNLLPKSKSHLRVLHQLQTEQTPADQLEIASEATLHRLSRSGTSTIPTIRPPPSHAPPSHIDPTHIRPTSSHALIPRPTPNRFPEQANDNDEEIDGAAGSSADEDDPGEAGSDWGGMSMGYGTEDEEERKMAIWTGIRGGGGVVQGQNSLANVGKSPGSEKGRMEVETPSTPSWHSTTRPGKRKMNDDRFEPYAQALKRRAVSPASGLSPSLGSPILSFHTGILPTPPPLPLSLSIAIPSSSLTLPISIPSPTLGPHHSFFRDAARSSRGGSPVASSLSSSAGNRNGMQVTSQALGMAMNFGTGKLEKEREDMERLGRMSLG